MNHDTTPDNEIEVSSKQTMLTAQSDSVELYHALCDRLIDLIEKTNEVARLRKENDEYKLSEAALSEELKISDDWLKHTRNEVARLRNLLDNMKQSRDTMVEDRNLLDNEVERLRGLLKNHAIFLRKNGFDRQADDLMRFAPAPEEPVIQDSRITEPEWRELGEDEVICEGDEVQLKHYSIGSPWIKVQYHEYGATPEDQEAMRYRTRRPLPKQEEFMSIFDYHLCMWEDSGANGDLLYCLRYLRDEIQKLKGAK